MSFSKSEIALAGAARVISAFWKTSLVQINSKLNSKPYDNLYKYAKCLCHSTANATYLLSWVNILFHECLHLFIQHLSLHWWLKDTTWRWIQLSKKAFPKIITEHLVKIMTCHTINEVDSFIKANVSLCLFNEYPVSFIVPCCYIFHLSHPTIPWFSDILADIWITLTRNKWRGKF